MAKVKLKLTNTDSKNDVRRLITFGPHGDMAGFLGNMGNTANAQLKCQLLNEDETFASGTVTMNAANLTNGDEITLGAMTLTAQSTTGYGEVDLGAASTFGLLAGSGITNTGSTVINGDIGSYPTTTITGFGPGVVNGTNHAGDSVTQQAKIDALATYTALSLPATTVIASALDGQTLTAGYYSFASGAATLAGSGNGTLTFSGSATDVFVVKTATTLGTGAGGIPTITLTGGALAANVFWIVGSSATINIGVSAAGATFRGTIIADQSVTATQSGIVDGRLIALNAAVTLSAANTVTVPTGGPVVLGTNEFFIGATNAESAANLAAAIGIWSNHLLIATASGAIVTVFANFPGFPGNAVSMRVVQALTGMTLSGSALTGGVDDSAPAVDWKYF